MLTLKTHDALGILSDQVHGTVTVFSAQASLQKAGIKIMSAHALSAFLGQLRF